MGIVGHNSQFLMSSLSDQQSVERITVVQRKRDVLLQVRDLYGKQHEFPAKHELINEFVVGTSQVEFADSQLDGDFPETRMAQIRRILRGRNRSFGLL